MPIEPTAFQPIYINDIAKYLNQNCKEPNIKLQGIEITHFLYAVLRFSRCPLHPFGWEHRSERVRDMLRRHYLLFSLPTLFIVARILSPGSLVLLFFLYPGYSFLTDSRRDHWVSTSILSDGSLVRFLINFYFQPLFTLLVVLIFSLCNVR